MIYKDRQSSKIEKKAQRTIGKTFRLEAIDASILEVFPYEYPAQEIEVELSTDEFTCICPFSGLPDFARLTIRYVPSTKCIELKSLKYYLYSFRQIRSFNEHVVNRILKDLVKTAAPRRMQLIAEFTVRGGMKNKVTASYPASAVLG